MPHTVATLRSMEHATQAYILLIDGIPIGFTTDTSGELTGSGASSYIGRAESDAGETVGGRELREGLIVPRTLSFGSLEDSLGLGRSTARFSVLLDTTTASYLTMSGEEPEEMLGRLDPTEDPAPATVIGVTVRDRYVGLEYVGSTGERRMFPFLMGASPALQGLDHHGDSDGATVPATVSERPLVHEGRLVSLYRVYRDPSSTSIANSDAWPSLSNYSPIWVGRMRDAGRFSAGGRITIDCTGFESLLERNMATVSAEPVIVSPDLTATGSDDQVAIYFGSGPQYYADTDGPFDGIPLEGTYEGRDWTTLSGSSRADVRVSLQALIQDTVVGVDTDFATSELAYQAVEDGDAGINTAMQFYIYREARTGTPYFYTQMRIAMHRRRWLMLGYDPILQDVASLSDISELEDVQFRKLTAGEPYDPRPNYTDLMGAVPGPGYYEGTFTTVAIGSDGTDGLGSPGTLDNGGETRFYNPLYQGVENVSILRIDGNQEVELADQIALIDNTHIAPEGAIDGSDCDAAGFFMFKGKIRKAEGETDDQTLVTEDAFDNVAIARCSWVQEGDYYSTTGSGALPRILINRFYDPRHFGYKHQLLDRDWATLELQMSQLHTFSQGATRPEPAAQTLSGLLRSTGSATSVASPGGNSGTATGLYADVYTAEMGLGIPSQMLPDNATITAAFQHLPNGASGGLARCRPTYEKAFPSIHALRALLEPRGVRIGFAGGQITLYRLADQSPEAATVHILESDLYGTPGDPTTVYPEQDARALAPVDEWELTYGENTSYVVEARDPGAPTRRGNHDVPLNAHGLFPTDYYGEDPLEIPNGAGWKLEAREFLGDETARFLARRHGKITLTVSRPKGQDLYPGTVVLLSNPWIWNEDGTQGISGTVGIVVEATHNLMESTCDATVLLFQGQWRPPAHYAPMLWIEEVVSSTELTIATSTDFSMGGGSIVGWTQPEWSAGGGGNLVGQLWRMLPDGTWTAVGTADVGSVNATTVSLATALTALPPDYARTMIFTPAAYSLQPAWAQEIYAGVGILGDNADTRRFV